jgi:hypothetical protein
MIRILFFVLAGLILSACAAGDRLATVSGPCWPMNAGQWTPPPGATCPPVAAR